MLDHPLTFSPHLGCLIRTDPRDKHAWEFASAAEEARSCRHLIATARAGVPALIADHRWYLAEARREREDGWPGRGAASLAAARGCRMHARALRVSRERATRRLAELEPAGERRVAA